MSKTARDLQRLLGRAGAVDPLDVYEEVDDEEGVPPPFDMFDEPLDDPQESEYEQPEVGQDALYFNVTSGNYRLAKYIVVFIPFILLVFTLLFFDQP